MALRKSWGVPYHPPLGRHNTAKAGWEGRAGLVAGLPHRLCTRPSRAHDRRMRGGLPATGLFVHTGSCGMVLIEGVRPREQGQGNREERGRDAKRRRKKNFGESLN